MAAGKSTQKKAKPNTRTKSATTQSRKAANSAKKKARSKKRTESSVDEEKDQCFVISPFGGWHDDYYSEIFCPAIKAAGLDPVRADDLFRSSNIVHDIWHLVLSSRVLLADLTGKNPNVFYELGLAHAARKPVLLMTQSMEDVPFDLRALRVITYDVEHPAWGGVLRDSIKQGLKEILESPENSVLPTFLVEAPDDQTHVSEEDAHLIGLQQQIDSLRSEVRSVRSPASSTRRQLDLTAAEAEELIGHFLNKGMPNEAITDRLVRLGAPKSWVRQELRRRSQ